MSTVSGLIVIGFTIILAWLFFSTVSQIVTGQRILDFKQDKKQKDCVGFDKDGNMVMIPCSEAFNDD